LVVYYRVHDERQSTPYKSLTMQRGTGNTFTALIPAVEVTDAGIDYYLSAWDTHSERADNGTTSNPYYVPARGCRLVGTPSFADVGSHNVVLAVSDGLATVPQQFTITVPTVLPKITALPQSLTVLAGGDASFQVTATGSAPLSYQWLCSGQVVAGATNSTLLFTNVQASQAGSHVVVITNLAGAVTSAPPAVLTMGQSPQVAVAPASQSLWQGGTVSLTATATGTAPLSYQWYGNGAAVPGATRPGLVFTNAVGSQSGSCCVVVANSCGAATLFFASGGWAKR
jgi:hypothetical protein